MRPAYLFVSVEDGVARSFEIFGEERVGYSGIPAFWESEVPECIVGPFAKVDHCQDFESNLRELKRQLENGELDDRWIGINTLHDCFEHNIPPEVYRTHRKLSPLNGPMIFRIANLRRHLKYVLPQELETREQIKISIQ